MSEKKVEETMLFPTWKELVKVAQTWEYGSFHSHVEIAGIMNVEPQSSKYYGHVQEARDKLILHGKLLDKIIGKGYVVVEVHRHDEATFEDVDKSVKYFKLSVMKSQFAPVELMDKGTRDKHDTFLIKQVGMLNMITPVHNEMIRVIAPIPKKFQIKEAKPEIKSEE